MNPGQAKLPMTNIFLSGKQKKEEIGYSLCSVFSACCSVTCCTFVTRGRFLLSQLHKVSFFVMCIIMTWIRIYYNDNIFQDIYPSSIIVAITTRLLNRCMNYWLCPVSLLVQKSTVLHIIHEIQRL